MSRPIRCQVESRLTAEQQLELDTLLADPTRWPKAIFEGWKLPPGSLPATMRSWGAVRLGIAWFEERSIPISKRQMQFHYEQHVPIIPYTPDDVVARATPPDAAGRTIVPASPTTYLEVYQKGLAVGSRALDLLMHKVEAMVAHGDTVPTDLLMQLGNLGVKLATSQAGIISRGFDMARQKEEEMAGFRVGANGEVSPRMQSTRVRVIEGETRAVVDRGRADRQEYNERARQEGSPLLPG